MREVRDVTDVEAERLASSFRPNRKPLFVALGANALLAVLLLGVPYLRGRSVAQQARRDFAKYSQCLMGGEVARDSGLSLPQGDRDHFAEKVMHAAPSWPLSCRPALQKLAPEPAVFLWPSVKTAGADLRAVVELSERELRDLDKRRKAGLHRVPERPLQALRRVQAAVVLLARAGGADANVDNDALVWKGPARLAVPARLPLTASDEATLDLHSTGTALEALALDSRGVSYLRVADGKVDRERVRRTSFVRGTVRRGDDAYLVWAMPDARCAEREDHCAGRPTGLAPYDKGAAALRDPIWKLAGHPAGRLDRVLSLTDAGRVLMVARGAADGGAALLRFQLEASAPTLGSAIAPASAIDPADRFEVSLPSPVLDVALVPGAEPTAVLAARAETEENRDLSLRLTWADAARPPVQLPSVNGETPWSLGCGSATAQLLAYGTTSQLRIVRVQPDGVVQELLTHQAPIPGAMHTQDPALDRVRLICAEGRAQLMWIDAPRTLWISVCEAESCSAPQSIASQVSSFAVLPTANGSVVALGSPADAVRILRLDPKGKPSAAAYSPSACFEPSSGLCGTASLVADAQRIVLTARDRSDLLALESTDGGATFITLSGLAGSGTIEQSKTAPLKQHRIRKGIE